jgi:hypothetical protein
MIYLCLTGVHSMSVHLVGGCLIGGYLTGVYLMVVDTATKPSCGGEQGPGLGVGGAADKSSVSTLPFDAFVPVCIRPW